MQMGTPRTKNSKKSKTHITTKSSTRCTHTAYTNNSEMWTKYKDQIMFIEQNIFDRNLQETEDELKKSFIDEDVICVMITKEGLVLGYMLGSDIKNYINSDDPEYNKELEKDKSCYVETISVHPNYQHMGYGTKLFTNFIKEAKRRKYKKVCGHFCKESTGIAYKFGGKIISAHKNYSDTGITYYFMVIKL